MSRGKSYKWLPTACAFAAVLCGAAPAWADSGGISSTRDLLPDDRGAGILGLKAGAFLPEAFSPLAPTYFLELEGGYLLPFAHRLLGITASFAVGMPTQSGAVQDPRVAGGSYAYSETTEQFMLGLNVVAKIPLGRFVPYIGVGPRLFIVQTPSSGSAADGTPMPQTTELFKELGVGVPIGLDILFGPGRLFAEFQLLYAPASPVHLLTGAGDFGSMSVAVGYRLILGAAPRRSSSAPAVAPPPPPPVPVEPAAPPASAPPPAPTAEPAPSVPPAP